ncbi:MAG: hypothetical protein Nk1A_9060 [Endomicrobiia bacterium]|nr:MAG: hypothetical protein Nk1A_9060 [Endomicrobiia bacterium]
MKELKNLSSISESDKIIVTLRDILCSLISTGDFITGVYTTGFLDKIGTSRVKDTCKLEVIKLVSEETFIASTNEAVYPVEKKDILEYKGNLYWCINKPQSLNYQTLLNSNL